MWLKENSWRNLCFLNGAKVCHLKTTQSTVLIRIKFEWTQESANSYRFILSGQITAYSKLNFNEFMNLQLKTWVISDCTKQSSQTSGSWHTSHFFFIFLPPNVAVINLYKMELFHRIFLLKKTNQNFQLKYF
jgi:hypothetical protein